MDPDPNQQNYGSAKLPEPFFKCFIDALNGTCLKLKLGREEVGRGPGSLDGGVVVGQPVVALQATRHLHTDNNNITL